MKLKIAFYIFLCLIVSLSAVAQDIKLNNLAKMEFIGSSPFWVGSALRVVEVLPEGNIWNSYQLALYQDRPKPVRDSIRKFIKIIPAKDLEQMLVYINKPDTSPKIEQFNISKDDLKRDIDTIQRWAKQSLQIRRDKRDSVISNLTDEQKAYFFKIIESKEAVKEACLATLHPIFDDDRSYYGMIFTYKDKHKDTVYAYVNGSHLYHLPWQRKNKPNYNPKLTELFESVMDNVGFSKREKNSLSINIDYELSRRWVITKISWDEYKINQPLNYIKLSKTLEPAYIYAYGQAGYLKSSLLPFNIQLRFGFTWGADTLQTNIYNACEKQLIATYYKGNFFFDYLKAHPTTVAMVQDIIPKTIEQVAVTFPEITKFDYRQIKFIYTNASFYEGWDTKRISRWLLLPNNNMILLSCSDQLLHDGDKIFADLTPIGKGPRRYYCIVYDQKGHKIAGGESEVKIELK